MADGFTLEIDENLARAIERRAKETGMSREEYVRFALTQQTFRYEDYEWIGDDPRTASYEVDPSDPGVPWEEVKVELADRLEASLAKQRVV